MSAPTDDDMPTNADAVPYPDEGADPLAALHAELEAARADADRYLDLARRTRADFENYQNRVRRDADSDRKYAATPFVAELLPVLDNLERALDAVKGKPEAEAFSAGIDIVRRQFMDVFGKHGVVRIAPDGAPFDPNLHQAIAQAPSQDHPPMTVLTTVEAGYKFHDRVVRPAKVIVVAPPS